MQEVLRSPDTRILMLCSRQLGKSTVAAILALHRATFFPGSLVLLLSLFSHAIRSSQSVHTGGRGGGWSGGSRGGGGAGAGSGPVGPAGGNVGSSGVSSPGSSPGSGTPAGSTGSMIGSFLLRTKCPWCRDPILRMGSFAPGRCGTSISVPLSLPATSSTTVASIVQALPDVGINDGSTASISFREVCHRAVARLLIFIDFGSPVLASTATIIYVRSRSLWVERPSDRARKDCAALCG